MPVLSLTKFSGVAPRVSPTKLNPEMAQTAVNVRLLGATLAPWAAPLQVVTGLTANDPSTIYRFGQDLTSDTQYWFHWTADVDVVKGAISGDQTEKTYFTHPTQGPRWTDNTLALTGGSGSYPWNSRPLGIPAPTATPTASISTVGSEDAPFESRVYCYTYVTSYGEESSPSEPSNLLDVRTEGAIVSLTNLPTVAPAGYDGYITAKRIYRTLSGNLTTEFQLVDEIPLATGTYSDTIASSSLSEVLPTATWTPPPTDAKFITQMANGIMLLFKDYDIYPSEAYVPYAYPIDYSLAVDYPIVGAEAVGSSAIVCTTGHPYLLTGSDPSALSLVKLDSPQACVSKRSIVAVDGGVMYASPDGLIMVTTSGGVQNMTDGLFSRDEWQDLIPASIDGYYHDGRYFGFYNTGSQQRGFIFDPKMGTGAFTFIDTYATAGFSDTLQDALYLKIGTTIQKWGHDTNLTSYTWKSAKFTLPAPQNPACAQVTATSYPATFKLYADGVLKHTQTVTNNNPFWLPSGYRAQFLEVELSGTAEIQSVQVAASPQELKGL